MLQQLAQVSAFSSPLIFRGKAYKKRCKCKLTFASAHLTLEPSMHRHHLEFFSHAKVTTLCLLEQDCHQNVCQGLLEVTGFVTFISPKTPHARDC